MERSQIINGVPKEIDYQRLKIAIEQVDKIWKMLPDLSYTPKYHSWLHHALPQMRAFDGFGDMLEDEVEKYTKIVIALHNALPD